MIYSTLFFTSKGLKENPNNISQIKDYYYVLGVCVLLQTLMKFQNPMTNFGFVRLCSQIAIYGNKLYQFTKKGIQEIFGTSDFSAYIIEGDFYITIIKQILSSKMKENLELQKQVLLDALYYLAIKCLCEAKHLEGSLFEEIADFIQENISQNDSQNWLLDDNEYLLWSYFTIIKQLFEESGSSDKEREQLCLIILNKLPALIKSKGTRRLSTLDTYYHLQKLAVSLSEKNGATYQNNLDLSESPLQEVLLQSEQDIFLNLRYSFGTIVKSTQLNSSLRNELFEEEKLNLVKENPNLKYILIFLAKIQVHKLPGETGLDSPFLLKWLSLLTEISHQLNVWDMLALQRVLYSALSSSNLSGEDSVNKLMKLYVKKITEANIIPKSFFSSAPISIIEDYQKAAYTFLTFLLSSIQDIKNSCDNLWEYPDSDSLKSLNSNKNRLLSFVRTWTEDILKAIGSLTSEEQKNTGFESLKAFCLLLLHPSLNLVWIDSEAKLRDETLWKILEKFNGLGSLFKNLEGNFTKISQLIEKSGLEVQSLPIHDLTSQLPSLHFSALLKCLSISAHILEKSKDFEERIKQIPQQDFESLIQKLSNLFESLLIYSQSNSIDFNKLEGFINQNLGKITEVLFKPLIMAKQKISILENFFDKFLTNQDLTSYHLIVFLNFINVMGKSLPDVNIIFRFILQNPKLWSMLMSSIKSLMKQPKKQRDLISKRLKDFIINIEKLFHVEVNAKNSKILLTAQLGYSLPIDQVIRDLIVSLTLFMHKIF